MVGGYLGRLFGGGGVLVLFAFLTRNLCICFLVHGNLTVMWFVVKLAL